MSFSTDVKKELSSLELGSEGQLKSELMGLVRTNSTLSINFQGDISLRFETRSSPLARRIFRIIKELYNYDLEISVVNDDQLKKKNLYQARISSEISRFILEDTGFSLGSFGYLSKQAGFDLCRQAQPADFLRGAFLGAGSVTDPKKAYHLEIIAETPESRDDIRAMSENLSIQLKTRQRKESYLLYLKDGDSISDLLGLMGAKQAMLEFENVRAYRDLKNTVNRIVNAETSNINKTVSTAVRQIRAIEKIEEEMGLSQLPDNLREIAIVRMANPNDSLKELGEKLPQPLGKSGVNHRLKKIEEIADSL